MYTSRAMITPINTLKEAYPLIIADPTIYLELIEGIGEDVPMRIVASVYTYADMYRALEKTTARAYATIADALHHARYICGHEIIIFIEELQLYIALVPGDYAGVYKILPNATLYQILPGRVAQRPVIILNTRCHQAITKMQGYITRCLHVKSLVTVVSDTVVAITVLVPYTTSPCDIFYSLHKYISLRDKALADKMSAPQVYRQSGETYTIVRLGSDVLYTEQPSS